jgi:hypothetical protein
MSFAVRRAYQLAIKHKYIRAIQFHPGDMAEAEYLDAGHANVGYGSEAAAQTTIISWQ